MCEKKKKGENERWEEMARKAKTEGQVWEVVNRVRVEDRIDSDHFPVMVEIKGKEKGVRKKRGGEKVKWEWSQEGKRIFREK